MRQIALGFFLLLATGCGPKVVKVTMNADNNSGQKGFAEITDLGAKGIRVLVETSSPEFHDPDPMLDIQKAHIHTGNCGEVGGKVGFLNPLKALADKPDRVGSTTDLDKFQFSALETGEWIINVHDERDDQIYVCCGEIPNA